MRRCTRCGSYAINPHRHDREPDADLDLCDVCYWRKRYDQAVTREPGTSTIEFVTHELAKLAGIPKNVMMDFVSRQTKEYSEARSLFENLTPSLQSRSIYRVNGPDDLEIVRAAQRIVRRSYRRQQKGLEMTPEEMTVVRTAIRIARRHRVVNRRIKESR